MARKTLTLTINLEGATLSDEWADTEATDLLHKASHDVRRLHDAEGWIVGEAVAIFDSNGNRVGEFSILEA